MTLLPAKSPKHVRAKTATAIAIALTGVYVWLFFTTPVAALGLHPRTREPMDRLGFHLWQVFHLPELAQQWFGSGDVMTALMDRLPILVLASVMLTTAFFVGRGLLCWLGAVAPLTRLEQVAFGTGLGLNTLSLATLMVGLAGWLRSPLGLLALLLVSLGCGSLNWWRADVGCEALCKKRQSWNRFDKLLAVVVAAFCVLIVVGSLLPPWHFDAKAYHLQAPKEWFASGQIEFMPHNVYANMPLGSEMHALLGMMLWQGKEAWWWGAIVGKVVIAAFAPLTALALYSFGFRFFSRRIGLVAALVFITCPWSAFLSFSGLIECVLGFYLLLGVYALAIRHSLRSGGPNDSLVLVAGLCAGSAAACKYPAVVFVVLPLLLAVAFWQIGRKFISRDILQHIRSIDVRAALLFLLAVAVSAGPWYVKNLYLTGNPTYPMLYSAFGGKGWDEAKDARWQQAHSPPMDANGSVTTIHQLGATAKVIGATSAGHSPLLLPLAACGLFAVGYRRWVIPLAGVVVYFVVVWWLATHHFDRFLVPLLPVLAVLCGIGWSVVEKPQLQSYAIGGLMLGTMCCGLLSISSVMGDNRFFEPLEEARSSRVHPMHQFMNHQLGDGDQVLLVGEATPFNITTSHLYNTCFDDCLFTDMMKGKTKAQRITAFRDANITHVFINWLDIAAYRRDGDYGYSPYVTRQTVYAELVEGDRLLVPVDTGMPPKFAELFRVVANQ